MKIAREDVVPINGTVYIVDDKKKEVSDGGIIMPDQVASESMICGTVLAVAPFLLEDGTLKDPPMVPGNRVLYGQHAGVGCVWEDKEEKRTYRMVKWNEVQAILKK